MFMGEYSHNIDAKGRMIVPSKFREQLGDEFVVTKGLDGCLFVYPNEEWQNIEEKIPQRTTYLKRCKKILTFLLCGSNNL